jgi:hypothetical protein
MAGRMIATVAALGFAAAMAAGGWTLYQAFKSGRTLAPGLATAQLGPVRLRYDPALGRATEDREGGRLDRLDIALRLPGYLPAGADSTSKPESLVFIRIEAADGSLAPEDRMDKLYVRFLEPDQWTHPGGLVMRRFEPGSPYEREELYFAPPEGRLFTARCTRPSQPPDGLPETCISDIRANGLDAHVRFAPDVLLDWERLAGATRGLLERMTR